MDANLRVVTQLPLQELWNDDGPLTATRERSLTGTDIKTLLRAGPVQFVVADVGTKLVWISQADACRFRKDEVTSHVTTNSKVILDDYPGGYCYFASAWKRPKDPSIIVLLEKSH